MVGTRSLCAASGRRFDVEPPDRGDELSRDSADECTGVAEVLAGRRDQPAGRAGGGRRLSRGGQYEALREDLASDFGPAGESERVQLAERTCTDARSLLL